MANGADFGTPYHAAVRLIGAAGDNWAMFDAGCAQAGFDPLALPLDRFCNLVEARIVEHMDESERDRFYLDLYKSPDGDVVAGPWSDAAMAAAFTANVGAG